MKSDVKLEATYQLFHSCTWWQFCKEKCDAHHENSVTLVEVQKAPDLPQLDATVS
jgi:hypothetical protein